MDWKKFLKKKVRVGTTAGVFYGVLLENSANHVLVASEEEAGAIDTWVSKNYVVSVSLLA